MKSENTSNKSTLSSVNIELLKLEFKTKYQQLLNSTRELTERKEALQTAFEEIEDIYNNAPCGYHSLDENAVFVRINDTELRWLGETREGFTGTRKFPDILTEESRQKFYRNYPLFIKSGHLHEEEYWFVRKDGSPVTLLFSAAPQKGSLKKMVCFALDISRYA